MPYFKTKEFTASNKAATEKIKIKININAAGRFYSYIPGYLITAIKGIYEPIEYAEANDQIIIETDTLAELEQSIQKALEVFVKPTILEKPVIRYNIESHVSFAEDNDGNIFPNAGFKNAEWRYNDSDNKYGNHHAATPSDGGYALKIAAKALLKITHKYGDTEHIEYRNYYKGGSHLGHDNPANLLNSWCSLTLGKNPKEIPYSDKAALFFHKLLLGMAQTSKSIQEATFDQDNLLELIAKDSNLLLTKRN